MDLCSPAGKDFLQKKYVDERKSPYEIAAELETYPKKVERALKKHGFDIRDRKEAQKILKETGRHHHPTRGRHRTPEEKFRIGQGISENWKKLPDEEKQIISEKKKVQWAEMDEDKKMLFSKLGWEALHLTAKEGSALEKHLLMNLQVHGYEVTFHQKFVVSNDKMHVDIVVHNPKVAIGIDGPSHFMPIYGEERLQKTKDADQRKTGLLLMNGYHVVRFRYLCNTLSNIKRWEAERSIIELLEELKEAKEPEFHELEV